MESAFVISFFISLFIFSRAAFGTKFTFVNACENTVWPGILPNAGTPNLDSTGFELPPSYTRSFEAPSGWSGRFWARTNCTFSGSGQGSCLTGDCGSNQVECKGNAAVPPATLAEITLGTEGSDYYDISLVDGYNLPMVLETNGGLGNCDPIDCVMDLILNCPAELLSDDGKACKSACQAFKSPEYCCSGTFQSSSKCGPTAYSQAFKSACPTSYSYAYDDFTSTFTCSGADYTVTFCPSSTTSQKTTKDPPPTMTTTPGTINGGGSLPGTTYPNTDVSGSGYGSGFTGSDPNSASGSGSQAMAADGSWLAGLAMGDSTRVYSSSTLHYVVSIAFAIFILSLFS